MKIIPTWSLPFISFFSGYILFFFLYTPQKLAMPSLIGKNIHEVAKILSNNQLNLRILKEKVDTLLPEGTIISQIPAPHQKIKAHQLVFCVVSALPPIAKAPYLIGKNIQEIEQALNAEGIIHKQYAFESIYPENYCFAQLPPPGQKIKDNCVITYQSKGPSSLLLMPNFVGKKIKEIKSLLELHDIPVSLIHKNITGPAHTCDECYVTEQKPLAGSFFTLKKCTLHLCVTS